MLTKSQKKTYDFIAQYIAREDISPTLKEISLGINIHSRGTVSRYVQSLIDIGLITRKKEKNTSRNLSLTSLTPVDMIKANTQNASDGSNDSDGSNNTLYNLDNKFNYALPHQSKFKLSIPLLGVIAAGKPIEAITDNENFNINDILYGKDLYMLKIKGRSMIEEGIHDGDYVICEPANTADNGEIVVALIDNEEATLKRLYKNADGTILLCPANSDMSPLEYAAHRVQIQGVLRCQLRTYY